MLEAFRRGQRWWTALVVVFVGGVFAVFIGLGGPLQSGSDQALVRVGDVRIGPGEFERARQQQIRYYESVLGDQFDAGQLGEGVVDGAAARLLIERTILAMEAERLGLTVAKQEVEREILANPGFRDPAGKFDPKAFENWVYYEFGSERAFREQQQRSNLAQKLLRVLSTQAFVSDGEARQAAATRLESVKLVIAVLDPAAAGEPEAADAEAVAGFLASRPEEVQKAYEERSAEFNTPEQTRARHILLTVPAEATEAQAAEVEARAKAVLARLRGGEDFALVAVEVSDDPGSKSNGGDLGWFARGAMLPAFEAAAFSLEPGVISEPIRTDYGFHIVLVEDRRPAASRSFEDVKLQLAAELLGAAQARDATLEKARALAEAVRSGQSLVDAARAAELTLERTDWISRRPDGFVPGVGAAQELMAAAFVVEPGTSSDRIFEVGDKLALIHVVERRRPEGEEFEAEVAAERERLRQQKLNLLTDTWVGQRRARLIESGELAVNIEFPGRS